MSEPVIRPPRRALDHPDHHLDCQAALDPAFQAYAERAEAAGTPNYELVDIAVGHQEHGTVGGKEADRDFLGLALEAEEAGWAPDEVADALVALAVARCQTALATMDTHAIIERACRRKLLAGSTAMAPAAMAQDAPDHS